MADVIHHVIEDDTPRSTDNSALLAVALVVAVLMILAFILYAFGAFPAAQTVTTPSGVNVGIDVPTPSPNATAPGASVPQQ